MRLYSAILLSVLIIPVTLVQGQTSDVATPSMGFVFDSGTGALRRILGIPGASLLGPALDGSCSLVAAAISPRQDYAFVLAGGDRQVRLARLQNGTTAWREISLPAGPDRILLSPTGSAAALYYSTPGVLHVVTGLPDGTYSDRIVDVSTIGQISSALAISDDGQLLLIGNPDEPGGVLLLRAGAEQVRLPLAGLVSAVAFRSSSDDAVITNQDGRISLVRALSKEPTYESLADTSSGLTAAIAAEFSADGARVYAVSAEGAIMSIGVAEKMPVVLNCHCKASGLYRLNGGTAFRLNEPEARPLLLLDSSTNPERVLFVPEDVSATAPARSVR